MYGLMATSKIEVAMQNISLVRLYKQTSKIASKKALIYALIIFTSTFALILSMPKNQLKAKIEEKIAARYKRKIEQHMLKMAPIGSVYYKEPVSVNFQSIKEVYSVDNSQQNSNSKSLIQTEEKQKIQEISITPRFNYDLKYYTPSFIVPYINEQSDKQLKKYHINKTKESENEIDSSQIMIPKPKSRAQFCAVCRNHYQDYLNHINDLEHKKSIKRSKFNIDIEYLTLLVKERNIKNNEKEGVMTRSAKRKFQMFSNDYFQLEMRSTKKRKFSNLSKQKSFAFIQEKEDPCGELQTPFNKKQQNETTVKSIYSIYSALD